MKNAELYQLVFRFLINPEELGIIKEVREKVLLEENLLRFIHISSNQLVLPLVYSRMKKTELTDLLPVELNHYLEELYQLNEKRNRGIILQIEEINNQLATAGIEPVYLKGTGNLLDGLYDNMSERLIGDIDFLVQKKDFLKSAELVRELGYKNDLKIYDDPATLKDYPRLIRDNTPAAIEIHQMPVIPVHAEWFNAEKVFKEKKQIVSFNNCFVPSDKHKLIINFIHCQLSNKGHKLRSISQRDMYDAFLIIKRFGTVEFLNEIHPKQIEKAQIYFEMGSSLQDEEQNRVSVKTVDFHKKMNWYLNHPIIHFLRIVNLKFLDLIFNRFIKGLFDKTTYKNLSARLSDPEWYRKRLCKGLKDYFA